jgi:hypothetical protein
MGEYFDTVDQVLIFWRTGVLPDGSDGSELLEQMKATVINVPSECRRPHRLTACLAHTPACLCHLTLCRGWWLSMGPDAQPLCSLASPDVFACVAWLLPHCPAADEKDPELLYSTFAPRPGTPRGVGQPFGPLSYDPHGRRVSVSVMPARCGCG